MSERDVRHLRLASYFQTATVLVAVLYTAIGVVNVSVWALTVSMFHDSAEEPAQFIFTLLIAVCVATTVFSVFVIVLALATGTNLRRRRRHRFNMVASLIECAFVPVGTIAGLFTMVVLNRNAVRAAFGASPSPYPIGICILAPLGPNLVGFVS
jgi:hypothetical protein